MTRIRATCLTIAAAVCASGQPVSVAPAFDAASVRPSSPDTKDSGVRFLPGGRFQARNSSLIAILIQAYDVTEFQIAAAPAWVIDVKTARFDIDATAPAGNVDTPRLKLMLQTLLADRFGLRVHQEMRPVPVYELLPAKKGLLLKPISDGGKPAFDFAPYGGHLSGANIRMADFIRVLDKWLDRPVLDKTGFSDIFNVAFSWAPGLENTRNPLPFAAGAGDPRPSLFTAIQEQLGLRLIAERDPLDVIVIDRVERPSPN